MKEGKDVRYIKRTQKDYSQSLRLQVVGQIERGELSTHQAQKKYGIQSRSTVMLWLRKYGNFDWENQTPSCMPKTPEQHGSKGQALREAKVFAGAPSSRFR